MISPSPVHILKAFSRVPKQSLGNTFKSFGVSQNIRSQIIRSFSTSNTRKNTFEVDKTSQDEAYSILNNQRKNRPVSPHLEIYEPQLTWYMSGAHRITGVALTFAFYGFLYTYLAAPYLGFTFTTDAIASTFASLPLVAKILLKTVASVPFTYHVFNGIRHLIWDFARELTLKGVYKTGYTVLALTAISSLGLAIFV